jgi:flagellar export protein FliJ
MTIFRFRLAPVLQMRQTHDENAQRALAQAERRVRDAAQQLAEAEQRLATAYRSATEATSAGAVMTTLDWHRNWIVAKTRDVDAARLFVQDCEDIVNVRTREAHAARRDMRVLERFRDRARATFDADVARQEMNTIDEVATLRAARRPGEEP